METVLGRLSTKFSSSSGNIHGGQLRSARRQLRVSILVNFQLGHRRGVPYRHWVACTFIPFLLIQAPLALGLGSSCCSSSCGSFLLFLCSCVVLWRPPSFLCSSSCASGAATATSATPKHRQHLLVTLLDTGGLPSCRATDNAIRFVDREALLLHLHRLVVIHLHFESTRHPHDVVLLELLLLQLPPVNLMMVSVLGQIGVRCVLWRRGQMISERRSRWQPDGIRRRHTRCGL
mmetsp:Transcript_24810/g.62383  ORF Transcript_24810/g.62383 Transcript_24810/m.62383 type:complete len:233 (+) Transcript_24810:1470-2168(+)